MVVKKKKLVRMLEKSQPEVDQSPPLANPMVDDEEISGKQANQTSREVDFDNPSPPLAFAPIRAKAEALKSNAEIPPIPTSNPSFSEFAEWMGLLQPNHWEKLTVYMYRTHPRILRELSEAGIPKYIDKISAAFTESDIIKRHGGGKYEFRCNTTIGKQLCRTTLAIDANQHEPIVNYIELDAGSSENKSFIDWLIAKGKVTKIEGKVVPVNPSAASETVAKQAITALERQLDKANSQPGNDPVSNPTVMAEVIKAISSANDPSKTLEMVRVMMEMNRPASVAVAPDNGSGGIMAIVTMLQNSQQTQMDFMKTMMQMQVDNAKANNEMMVKMLEQKTNAQQEAKEDKEESDFDKFARMLEIAKMVKGGGASAASEPALWEKALAALSPIIAPAIGALAQNGFRMPGVVMPQSPPTMPTGTNPDSLALAPAPQSNPGDDMLKQNLGGAAQYILNALAQNQHGAEFADNLIRVAGMQVYSMVANHGPEKILATMKDMPQFWQYIQGIQPSELKVKEFVEQFCKWQEWADAQDAEEGEVE